MGIKENVEAAALADLKFEDIEKEMGTQIDRFWERMAELCLSKTSRDKENELPKQVAMSEREAIAFERLEMEWGVHKGEEMGKVPTEYLVFVTEGNKFKEKLERYIQSERFRKRQREEA